MTWHSKVIVCAAALGAIELFDMAFHLRFRFPPGSVVREYFFSEAVGLAFMILSLAAVVGFARRWGAWTKRERYVHASLLALPIAFWVCFFGGAFVFALKD